LGNGMGLIAQSSISGKVIDNKTGEILKGASVLITNKGGFIYKEIVDVNGVYKVNVDAGEYVVSASCNGYPSFDIENVIVYQNRDTDLDIELELPNNRGTCGEYVVYGYRKPIFKKDMTTTGETIITTEIKNLGFNKLPTRDINEIIIQTPGVSWQK